MLLAHPCPPLAGSGFARHLPHRYRRPHHPTRASPRNPSPAYPHGSRVPIPKGPGPDRSARDVTQAIPRAVMVEPDTLIATLLGDNGFQPLEAQTLEQAGLNEALVDSLICKHLNVLGNAAGR